MKATSLRGMSVVSIDSAEVIGRVDDLILDADAQRIVALRLQTPSGSGRRVVPVDSVRKIGKDVVTLEEPSSTEKTRPTHEEMGTDTEQIDTLAELLGAKAVSYQGDVLGTVADVDFDPDSFRITGYELSTGGLSSLTGSRKKVQAVEGIHYGKTILTVPDEVHAVGAGEGEITQADAEEMEGRRRRR